MINTNKKPIKVVETYTGSIDFDTTYFFELEKTITDEGVDYEAMVKSFLNDVGDSEFIERTSEEFERMKQVIWAVEEAIVKHFKKYGHEQSN
jgi:hypothetical protein